ncbi:hypothetical protein RF11_16342 [Thelohanellus kitauei]|uniref:Uncharacterized protein n=1 Tax=Thelohanellus kitauei TaxID=669202 RepID=A0A0C2M970_THEKT|nr:hypothetical protein RF11_16342 [Thelohanellus kitauei]
MKISTRDNARRSVHAKLTMRNKLPNNRQTIKVKRFLANKQPIDPRLSIPGGSQKKSGGIQTSPERSSGYWSHERQAAKRARRLKITCMTGVIEFTVSTTTGQPTLVSDLYIFWIHVPRFLKPGPDCRIARRTLICPLIVSVLQYKYGCINRP